MKKQIISFIFILLISYLSYLYGGNSKSILEETNEYNNTIYSECFGQEIGSGTDSEKYRASTACWKSKRRNTPDNLYLTVPRNLIDEGKCSISQSEDTHVEAKNGGMYATDLACNFKEQGVYAPDYLDDMKEYKIEEVGYDNLLGNFVILSFIDSKDNDNTPIRWYFGHTVLDSKLKIGDIIHTGVRFGSANISGATTGWHTHIELRRMYDGVWQSVRYVTRFKERALDQKRMGGGIQKVSAAEEQKAGGNTSQDVILPFGRTPPLAPDNQIGKHQFALTDTFYFTHYTLGDVNQNDADPCISADGKDSCKLAAHGRGTMALTVDLRNALGIKLGDKVALTGDVGCEGVYTVTDEMACRYRGINSWSGRPCYYSDKVTPTPKNSNVYRPKTPYFIKGDLPGKPGGACQVKKL